MSSTVTTFMDALLQGDALVKDFDDWVDRWHDAEDESPIASLELHDFLGLTFDEYSIVATRPSLIAKVAESREFGTPTVSMQELQKASFNLAARSKDSEQTLRLAQRLINLNTEE